MNLSIITAANVAKRRYWVSEIQRVSGRFADDFSRLSQELSGEVRSGGIDALLCHIRLCGAIPELYGHDSSEEKLYSKYTDAVLFEAFNKIGLTSLVLEERGDSADVECVSGAYSFVADAKAFRLSRTAKNQKDFKVQAMDGWKKGKPFAILVCPFYQLPNQSSQIYEQAIARDVCILSYSHLAVLVRLAELVGAEKAVDALHTILKVIDSLNPSKMAFQYWQAVNRTLLSVAHETHGIWREEKLASIDSIAVAKEEGLIALAAERERIMLLPREAAITELIKKNKIESRIQTIKSVGDTGILAMV